MKDHFLTIKESTLGEFKDRGSKFLAYAFPIQTTDELSVHLDRLRKEHLKACHHCFAFRLGVEGDNFRANDDGEPSGTAGKPILGQLVKNDLTDIVIIVVRYFGGTKLGTSGLINAYKQASIYAIEEAIIIEKIVVDHCRLSFDYAEMGHVMESVKALGLEILEKHFEATAYIIIGIRQSKVAEELRLLKAKLLRKQLNEITEKSIVPFCKIEIIETYA